MKTPTLAPPGSGLPKWELMLVRFFFHLYRRNATPRKLRLKLDSESKLTRNLLTQFSPPELKLQTLIPRIGGIEDSSRNWSVLMTLQHLVITTVRMMGISAALSKGQGAGLPEVKVEAVKPSTDVPDSVVDEFWSVIKQLELFLKDFSNERGGPTHPHPWFGQLSAHGWATLAVIHIGVHRRQIAMIRACSRRKAS